MSKNRIEWIDFARGIGILLMVIGHAGNIPNVKLWIYSFHMPLFFILTGYICSLSKRERFRGKNGLTTILVRNAKAYLIPYCLLFSVNLVLQLTLDFAKGIRGGIIDNLVRYCLRGFLYSYDTDYPNCSPLWFLTCLFIAYILFWVLMQCGKYKPVVALMMIGILLLVLQIEKQLNTDELLWHIDVALIASVFMLIGFYLPIFQRWLDNKRTVIRICVLSALFIVGSVIGIFNGRINMVKNEYQNIVFFFISAISISVVIVEVCRLVIDKQFPLIKNSVSFWGKNTLIFMGFNYFVNTIVRVIFGHFHLEETIFYSIFDIIIVMISCSIIALLWNRLKGKISNNSNLLVKG